MEEEGGRMEDEGGAGKDDGGRVLVDLSGFNGLKGFSFISSISRDLSFLSGSSCMGC